MVGILEHFFHLKHKIKTVIKKTRCRVLEDWDMFLQWNGNWEISAPFEQAAWSKVLIYCFTVRLALLKAYVMLAAMHVNLVSLIPAMNLVRGFPVMSHWCSVSQFVTRQVGVVQFLVCTTFLIFYKDPCTHLLSIHSFLEWHNSNRMRL